jgi:hypothetical protein
VKRSTRSRSSVSAAGGHADSSREAQPADTQDSTRVDSTVRTLVEAQTDERQAPSRERRATLARPADTLRDRRDPASCACSLLAGRSDTALGSALRWLASLARAPQEIKRRVDHEPGESARGVRLAQRLGGRSTARRSTAVRHAARRARRRRRMVTTRRSSLTKGRQLTKINLRAAGEIEP